MNNYVRQHYFNKRQYNILYFVFITIIYQNFVNYLIYAYILSLENIVPCM